MHYIRTHEAKERARGMTDKTYVVVWRGIDHGDIRAISSPVLTDYAFDNGVHCRNM